MAEITTKKYLDLTGLGKYDVKIKGYAADKANAAKNDAVTASKVTVDTSATSEGYAKSYAFKQNGETFVTIDIPKDMVVSSGDVVVLADGDVEGLAAGTYIKLVISNATNDVLYIPADKLVDIYVAEAEATQIQLAVSEDNVISATVVAGSIGKTELAADVVTSLGKADTAVQTVEIGETNGTIKVDGEEVAVAGLGDAAYAKKADFDAAGTAADAVKELADGQVATNTGNITTNTNDISDLKDKVEALEEAEPQTISEAEINALFTTTEE